MQRSKEKEMSEPQTSREEIERINADLAWWKEVFGDTVFGWTDRYTASLDIGGNVLVVNRDQREWFRLFRESCFKEGLKAAADEAFLRPLIQEQSEGEWDDETVDKDVQTFSKAILAIECS